MQYFLTGATGFIGRHLAELLVRRGETCHCLVREGSRARLETLARQWGAAEGQVRPVVGDIAEPQCGIPPETLSALADNVDHFFHLAAVYDMEMTADTGQRMNVDGTRHALDVARAVNAGCFHHVSSIAVAGRFRGNFLEAMFDEGQELEHPYLDTKYRSEALVRDVTDMPYRIYRPGVVVGHSRTGVMDKVDGPYYLFKMLQRLRALLPAWVPLVGIEGGRVPIVPVDFVADAMAYLAHAPNLDGKTFHLVDPNAHSVGDAINIFCRAAHAPEFAMRLDIHYFSRMIPKTVRSMIMAIPAVRGIGRGVLEDMGIPTSVMQYIDMPTTFDTREVDAALADSGISCPPLERYAPQIWDYWERHLDPDVHRTRDLSTFLAEKVVVITGASSGIGLDVARQVASHGGIPLMVARSMDKLEAAAEEIRAAGGDCRCYSADLSNLDDCDALVKQVLDDFGYIDILVNNAGRSIRRSVALSYDRFHDFERTMQLNYFGALRLIMGFLPVMRQRKRGHIVNVSSIGVQAGPARFSAYISSKAALDAFSRSLSVEVRADNVRITCVYMPLVRTPMIAPTTIYRHMPTLTSDEGARLVTNTFLRRPKTVSTRLGTFASVLEALVPNMSERIQSLAYQIMPESSAAKGKPGEEQEVSVEAVVLSNLLRGMYL